MSTLRRVGFVRRRTRGRSAAEEEYVVGAPGGGSKEEEQGEQYSPAGNKRFLS